jgi:hypothetical protein
MNDPGIVFYSTMERVWMVNIIIKSNGLQNPYEWR